MSAFQAGPTILAYRTPTHAWSFLPWDSPSILPTKTPFSLNHDPFPMTWLSHLVHTTSVPVPQLSNFYRSFFLISQVLDSARKESGKEKNVGGRACRMRRLTGTFVDSGWNMLGWSACCEEGFQEIFVPLFSRLQMYRTYNYFFSKNIHEVEKQDMLI